MRTPAWFLCTAMLLSSCSGGNGHHHHHHPPVPAAYAGRENPLAGDAAAAAAGAELYALHCESCHGPEGRGDGPDAPGLDPPPSDLVEANHAHDDYLYWRIAEGGNGEPIESEMPGWKGRLSEDEIWQLVTFLRSLSSGARAL